MIEIRWITFLFFLILQFIAVTGQYSSITVREGDEVTLQCENVTPHQHECDGATWFFSGSRDTVPVELVRLGQIVEKARDKSDRLSVTEKCSLVIKRVTAEDAGRYDCQRSGHTLLPDTVVLLSTVKMTEHKEGDAVSLCCSVSTYRDLKPSVRWLFEDKNSKEDDTVKELPKTEFSASVGIPSSYLKLKYHELFKCEVTDGYSREVRLFTFSTPSSGEDTTSATVTIRTTKNGKKSRTNMETSATSDTSPKPQSFWLYIGVAVGLAALLITIVAVTIWKRTKGNKMQMDENAQQRLNRPETQPGPDTRQDTADPEDGVSYASISYARETDREARVRVKDADDEGDAVIYSTVKASSSSAGASTDPSDLDSTVNNAEN